MTLCVPLLAGLLYGLLGVLGPGLLALTLAETGVGALGAGFAVILVLPVTTHSVTDAWIQRALRCVHACTVETARRLAGSVDAGPAPRVAELEQMLGRVRLSGPPAGAPADPDARPQAAGPARARPSRRLRREVRGLVAVAAGPEASHDARLTTACRRVESAVQALTEGGDILVQPDGPSATEPVLARLHGLERALAVSPGRCGRRRAPRW